MLSQRRRPAGARTTADRQIGLVAVKPAARTPGMGLAVTFGPRDSDEQDLVSAPHLV